MHRRLAQQLILATLLLWSAVAGRADPQVFVWEKAADWFGGFSAIAIIDGGHGAWVLSDRGLILRLQIDRQAGEIIAVRTDMPTRLRDNQGRDMSGPVADAEGIAITPDGSICISFEGLPRVTCHAHAKAPAAPLPRPDSFVALKGNRALEALAVDKSGQLYTLPEAIPPDGLIPIHRWDGARWTIAAHLPADGRFLPVGADFGPDGHLYILERAVGLGFRSQIRRIHVETGTLSDTVDTLWSSRIRAFDNLEGLSVWSTQSGDIRATMISDDNFLSLQRTELVEIGLPSALAKPMQTH